MGIFCSCELQFLLYVVDAIVSRSRWVIESARLYNRFLKMDSATINKKVLLYDKALCKDNWSASFKTTLIDIGLEGHLC